MRIQTKIPLAVISACLLVGSANSNWAQNIGANFAGRDGGGNALSSSQTLLAGEEAGVVPQTNWNSIAGSPFSGTSSSLIDAEGSFTGVRVIYDASDSWNSDGPAASPNEKLMKGIHKANPDPDLGPIVNNSDRMLFTITNLPPTGVYDVLVYAIANGANAKMDVTLGATTYYILEENNFAASPAFGTFIEATSVTPGNYADANYAKFTGVSPAANGTITITCRKLIENPQVNDGIGVAAIQLVKVSGPAYPVNAETCSITADPQSPPPVVEGKLATFTVGTQGPCKIQWTKNNLPIPGAINPTLTFVAAITDNNAQIRAVVYNNVITNTSNPALLTVVQPTLTQGFLGVDRWENIGGATGAGGITDLKNAIASAPPTASFFVAGPNVPQTSPNIANFGGRLVGWFQPDVTGHYDFFIRSDDSSQLFLNSVNAGSGTNTLPDINTEAPIAQEDGCCAGFEEPGVSSATTATPILLEAGKLYGAVILYKEGGGGDFVQVAWRRTNDTTAAAALRPISAANSWTLATAVGQTASITRQPVSLTVFEGRPAKFVVGATTAPTPGLYGVQWTLVSGGNIVGANADTYTIPATALSDNNKQLYARVFTLTGPLTSSVVTLTVLPDTNPPVPSVGSIIGTNVSGSTVQVGVGFDEPVNVATLVPANFTLLGGSGTIRFPTNSFGDFKGVVFDTTGLIPGNSYTVRVANVSDPKGNAISSSGIDVPFTVRTSVGWADTGTPIRPGQVIPVGNQGFDILNGGRGEWGTYDEATIAYMRLTNDFDVKVQVVYAEPGSQWTRVGLQARNDLNVGQPADDRNNATGTASAYAQTHINPNQTIWSANRIDPTGLTPANVGPNNGHEQNQRLATGGATSGWGSGVGGVPEYPNEWLRLQRTGGTLHGYRSQDGINWIDQGTTTLTDQSAVMHVGPFAAVETANIWNTADHDVWAGPFDPKFDRLFVYQFRNFGNTFGPTLTLSISRSGNNVTVTYTGVLYSATSLGGPWTPVSGATSPYTTAPSGSAVFYRAGEQ